jgi:hypothetical protein
MASSRKLADESNHQANQYCRDPFPKNKNKKKTVVVLQNERSLRADWLIALPPNWTLFKLNFNICKIVQHVGYASLK